MTALTDSRRLASLGSFLFVGFLTITFSVSISLIGLYENVNFILTFGHLIYHIYAILIWSFLGIAFYFRYKVLAIPIFLFAFGSNESIYDLMRILHGQAFILLGNLWYDLLLCGIWLGVGFHLRKCLRVSFSPLTVPLLLGYLASEVFLFLSNFEG
ncbi:MAG: hypothetical protein JRN03_06095 [Nitrososphaerota archaeon]|nr:hypothetical protein [Nitrososphaerota archaeon]